MTIGSGIDVNEADLVLLGQQILTADGESGGDDSRFSSVGPCQQLPHSVGGMAVHVSRHPRMIGGIMTNNE